MYLPVPLEGDPNWPTGSYASLPGWYMGGGSGIAYNFGNGDGSAAGTFNSFGQPGSLDRALGMRPNSGTSSPFVGLLLRNNTGHTLTSFTVSFRGEQWVAGSDDATYRGKMSFSYAVAQNDAPAGLASSEFLYVPALTFDPPNKSGTGLPIDGNSNFVNLSDMVTGVNWVAGEYLWLSWATGMVWDGVQHRVAIDDLSFAAVPEPATLSLLALGGLLALRRRR